MTVGSLQAWKKWLRLPGLLLGAVCLMGVTGWSAAAQVTVVLSDDTAPYQEVYQIVRAYLDESGHEVSRLYADGLTQRAIQDTRLIVAVGVRSAESLSVLGNRSPVLAVLVPRAWYLKTGRVRLANGRRNVSAIYIDQPFDRQAQLIRLALPEVRRVGVLLSVDQEAIVSELGDALRAQQLGLMHVLLDENDRLITPLETVLSEVDLLLAVPDPLIFNRNTAQSLLLTSYRYRDPVMGYSRSLTRAGALLSLHSSPSQIGRQAAEWVRGALGAAPPRLPPPAHPAYFSVSVNEQVARSLGFSLPSEDELEKRLGGGR